ncbi:MAG: SDR family NAD(P)-dependent oxidoreductase, partial [Methyloligellaceae bacterium]
MSEQKTIALVTGATGVIAGAIAEALAATPDYEVVILARNEKKAQKTVARIQKATGNAAVRYLIADVSRRDSVQQASEAWDGRLNILVNAAGVAPRERNLTPEGIEETFATNVLGYLRVTDAFAPFMKGEKLARIVNVASYWAGDLDLDDLEFERRPFHNHPAYRQSKQANRMLSVIQAERLEPEGILLNSCHPGDPSSVLSRNLGFGSPESAESAART